MGNGHNITKLYELENRKKKLERGMQVVQLQIDYEKLIFREAIDLEIKRKQEDESSIKTRFINPLNLDSGEIKICLQDCQQSLLKSQSESDETIFAANSDIERLKSNLLFYKQCLKNLAIDHVAKGKRKAAEKVIKKHFQEVEGKCSEQSDYIEIIQKSIGNNFDNEFCAKNL